MMFHIGQLVVIKADKKQIIYLIDDIGYDIYGKRCYSLINYMSGKPAYNTFYDDELRKPTT